MASALAFTSEQDACVVSIIGEMKKKHRKALLYPMATVATETPSDSDKISALDNMFSGTLGLVIITMGATNLDKWKPFSDSFKFAKLEIATKCRDVFDADMTAIFELEENS